MNATVSPADRFGVPLRIGEVGRVGNHTHAVAIRGHSHARNATTVPGAVNIPGNGGSAASFAHWNASYGPGGSAPYAPLAKACAGLMYFQACTMGPTGKGHVTCPSTGPGSDPGGTCLEPKPWNANPCPAGCYPPHDHTTAWMAGTSSIVVPDHPNGIPNYLLTIGQSWGPGYCQPEGNGTFGSPCMFGYTAPPTYLATGPAPTSTDPQQDHVEWPTDWPRTLPTTGATEERDVLPGKANVAVLPNANGASYPLAYVLLCNKL